MHAVQWMLVNKYWLIPMVVAVASTLATGLSDYPKAAGAVKWLRLGMSLLSMAEHADAPGSLKLPLMLPAKPVQS
jgi:hypothetical protein